MAFGDQICFMDIVYCFSGLSQCLHNFLITKFRARPCRLASGVSVDRGEFSAGAQHAPFNSQEAARRDLMLGHRAFVYQSISNVL